MGTGLSHKGATGVAINRNGGRRLILREDAIRAMRAMVGNERMYCNKIRKDRRDGVGEAEMNVYGQTEREEGSVRECMRERLREWEEASQLRSRP